MGLYLHANYCPLFLVSITTPGNRSVVAKRTTAQTPPTVDLTRANVAGGGGRPLPGQATNRQGGHRFPCLMVQPKAMKVGTNLAAKKTELDTKVKQVRIEHIFNFI